MPDDATKPTPTNPTTPETQLPALGLEGLWKAVGNFSAVVIMSGIMIYLVVMFKGHLEHQRDDMRQDRESSRNFGREAHDTFVKDAVQNREQMRIQWEEVRKANEIARELQRDIRENQATIKELIVEMKKPKISTPPPGGSQ